MNLFAREISNEVNEVLRKIDQAGFLQGRIGVDE